ncbi:MAG: hypothetical protein QOG56_255 [Solirubrobacteraceae bacterium]|nr:hypothetical protein [Solirubrobacteraceae bacterium]
MTTRFPKRTTNLAGQTYGLMVLTPIRPGHEDELRAYLDGLHEQGSPLARLPRTHLARWLIMPDMPVPPGVQDPLDGPYLLFTSNFDGDLASYLHELAERLVPEAQEIWGRCIGCPRPAEGAALAAYLGRNQLDSGFVFAAYGASTVHQIRGALDKRARLQDFVVRSQEMDPAQRRKAFLAEFGDS